MALKCIWNWGPLVKAFPELYIFCNMYFFPLQHYSMHSLIKKKSREWEESKRVGERKRREKMRGLNELCSWMVSALPATLLQASHYQVVLFSYPAPKAFVTPFTWCGENALARCVLSLQESGYDWRVAWTYYMMNSRFKVFKLLVTLGVLQVGPKLRHPISNTHFRSTYK